jgi:hypothetical protein
LDFFDKSLFFMGEFGVNDYSFSILGMPLADVYSIVPSVVGNITEATKVTVATIMLATHVS